MQLEATDHLVNLLETQSPLTQYSQAVTLKPFWGQLYKALVKLCIRKIGKHTPQTPKRSLVA